MKSACVTATGVNSSKNKSRGKIHTLLKAYSASDRLEYIINVTPIFLSSMGSINSQKSISLQVFRNSKILISSSLYIILLVSRDKISRWVSAIGVKIEIHKNTLENVDYENSLCFIRHMY